MPDLGQKRKRSNRAFSSRQASRLGGGGGEGRQAGSPEEREVNKRVLKELLPIHCIKKKKIFSQLSEFPFFTVLLQSWGSECSEEVVLTRQLRL